MKYNEPAPLGMKALQVALVAAFTGLATAFTGIAAAQSASDEYRPAQPGIQAGSAVAGKPGAGSLTAGPPRAGSLTIGKPRAGSLGGNIGAGSIAPAAGVPLTVGQPMNSIGVPLTAENLRTRRVTSEDIETSRTARRSRRSTR